MIADISLWFDRRRGMAVAICSSGSYVAGATWPLIIQPLVENAVKHGVAPSLDGGVVGLHAERNGAGVKIVIENPFEGETTDLTPDDYGTFDLVRQHTRTQYARPRTEVERKIARFLRADQRKSPP